MTVRETLCDFWNSFSCTIYTDLATYTCCACAAAVCCKITQYFHKLVFYLVNSVIDYIDIVAFSPLACIIVLFCMFLSNVTHVTTHVTVCIIWHAEIKGYLFTYLLTMSRVGILFGSGHRNCGLGQRSSALTHCTYKDFGLFIFCAFSLDSCIHLLPGIVKIADILRSISAENSIKWRIDKLNRETEPILVCSEIFYTSQRRM